MASLVTVVILEPGPVLGWKREIADWVCADIRRRYQSLQSLTITLFAGDAHPVTSLLGKVPCTPNQARMGHLSEWLRHALVLDLESPLPAAVSPAPWL